MTVSGDWDHLREFSDRPNRAPGDRHQSAGGDALLITGQQLLNHGITLVRDLGHELPKVNGDSNQLEQVFLNLISNARDAIDDAEGRKKEVRIRSTFSRMEGSFVVVSVKDTGLESRLKT